MLEGLLQLAAHTPRLVRRANHRNDWVITQFRPRAIGRPGDVFGVGACRASDHAEVELDATLQRPVHDRRLLLRQIADLNVVEAQHHEQILLLSFL